MNIWIFNHHAEYEGRHPSFAKYLSKLNVKVTLFSSSFFHNTFKEMKKYKTGEYFLIENIDGYRRIFIKTPKYYGNSFRRVINQLAFSFRAYKIGKKKLLTESTPDVIIGSSVHLFTGLAAYFLAKKVNTKFIFEVRDIWPQTLVDLGALKENSIVTIIFREIEKFLYKKADLIISVLPDAHKHITKYGIEKNKIIYIPNGIDLDFYNESIKKELKDRDTINFFEKNKDKFIVTFAGAHGIANGLDTVVHAAKILEDLEANDNKQSEILLIGDGPEKKNLIKLAKELGVKNITFLNKISRDQIPHVLEKSDVCLFHLKASPVFKYGLSSNKLFDYMISGKPMIFSVETSYNFAKEANNGISIPPENPRKMAEAIIELKNISEKERKELGENGKDFVVKKHSYKELALKLYNQILNII